MRPIHFIVVFYHLHFPLAVLNSTIFIAIFLYIILLFYFPFSHYLLDNSRYSLPLLYFEYLLFILPYLKQNVKKKAACSRLRWMDDINIIFKGNGNFLGGCKDVFF